MHLFGNFIPVPTKNIRLMMLARGGLRCPSLPTRILLYIRCTSAAPGIRADVYLLLSIYCARWSTETKGTGSKYGTLRYYAVPTPSYSTVEIPTMYGVGTRHAPDMLQTCSRHPSSPGLRPHTLYSYSVLRLGTHTRYSYSVLILRTHTPYTWIVDRLVRTVHVQRRRSSTYATTCTSVLTYVQEQDDRYVITQ
jgi:hypothetical protein